METGNVKVKRNETKAQHENKYAYKGIKDKEIMGKGVFPVDSLDRTLGERLNRYIPGRICTKSGIERVVSILWREYFSGHLSNRS